MTVSRLECEPGTVTRLLVSVVDAEEARAALAGGADVIDVKNPAEGPLGVAPARLVWSVCQAVGGRRPVSVALGEFPGRPAAAGLMSYGAACCQPHYVKVGFLGSTPAHEVRATLIHVRDGVELAAERGLTGGRVPQVVAVAYADTLGKAWALEDLVDLARAAGAGGCLVDTWDKAGPGLLEVLPEEHIDSFVRACRERGLFAAVAGRLSGADLPRVAAAAPDIVGFRSAACGGDRLRGRVTAARVAELKRTILAVARAG